MVYDLRYQPACFTKLKAVTPSDTVDLPDGISQGLIVGTAGSANLVMADGSAADGVPLQAGYNPLQVKRVKTGGTASNIWAGYFA